jgi:hypothetical protein
LIHAIWFGLDFHGSVSFSGIWNALFSLLIPPQSAEVLETRSRTMQENRNYQRELAECLIKAVGFENAMDMAQANHWEGVVHQIQFASSRLNHNGDDTVH